MTLRTALTPLAATLLIAPAIGLATNSPPLPRAHCDDEDGEAAQ